MQDKECYETYLAMLDKAAQTYGKDYLFEENNRWSYILSISQNAPNNPIQKEQNYQLMKQCLLADLNEVDKTQHRYTYNLPSISVNALIDMIDKANNQMSPEQCVHIYSTMGPSEKNYLDLLDKLCLVKNEKPWRVPYFCTLFSQPVIVENIEKSNHVFNHAMTHLDRLQNKLPENSKLSQKQMVEMIYSWLQNNPHMAQEISDLDVVSRVRLLIDENHVLSLMKTYKKDYLKNPMIGFSELKTYTMELNRDHLALHYEIRDESHFQDIVRVLTECFKDSRVLKDTNARAIDFSACDIPESQNVYIQATPEDKVNFNLVAALIGNMFNNAQKVFFSYSQTKKEEEEKMQWMKNIFFEHYMMIKLDTELPINNETGMKPGKI
jgi:hypothetical protein